MTREGEIFKQAVDFSSYTIDEVIEITGISRGQLYNLYKQDVIKPVFKEKIKKLKLKIDYKLANEYNPLQKEIEHLREQVALLTKVNDGLMAFLKEKDKKKRK